MRTRFEHGIYEGGQLVNNHSILKDTLHHSFIPTNASSTLYVSVLESVDWVFHSKTLNSHVDCTRTELSTFVDSFFWCWVNVLVLKNEIWLSQLQQNRQKIKIIACWLDKIPNRRTKGVAERLCWNRKHILAQSAI